MAARVLLGILVAGIAFIGLTAGIISIAPYLALGIIIVLVIAYLWVKGRDFKDKEDS